MNEVQLQKAEKGIERLLTVIAETDAFDDPVSLANIMVRLAYFNHTIGRHLAGLQAAYRQKRAEVYNEYMETAEKKVVTHAKQKAEEAGQALETKYDHYTNIHSDTDKFITVCQTHLRILGMEAKSQL